MFGSFLRNSRVPLSGGEGWRIFWLRAHRYTLRRRQIRSNSHRYRNDNSISTRRILIVASLVLVAGSFLPGEYIQTYISPYDSNTILNGTVPLADSTSREFRRRIRRFVDLFSVSSPTFLESWYIRIRRACIRIERASLRTRRFQSRFCPGYCRLARLPYTRPYIFPNHFEPILAPPPVPYQNFPVSADTRTTRGG